MVRVVVAEASRVKQEVSTLAVHLPLPPTLLVFCFITGAPLFVTRLAPPRVVDYLPTWLVMLIYSTLRVTIAFL